MILCDYGCGREAKYQFKNGKWCCSKSKNSCPKMKEYMFRNRTGKNHPLYNKDPWNKGKINIYSNITLQKMKENNTGKKLSISTKEKISKSLKNRTPWNKGKTYDELFGRKKSEKLRLKHSIFIKKLIKKNKYTTNTISKIKNKYPLFYKIEVMRYNPNKSVEKEIQVHCKNHNCPNSKEQGGWFTPTKTQLYERIRCIEKNGTDNSYFYCSEECKSECPLYNSKGGDPFKDIIKPYTQSEYQTFRDFVLKRDNYKCQYCGKKAEHVHHERPQKLEPFFALDPDLTWSVCKKCHYKYGHKTSTECSTGKLSNVGCGV